MSLLWMVEGDLIALMDTFLLTSTTEPHYTYMALRAHCTTGNQTMMDTSLFTNIPKPAFRWVVLSRISVLRCFLLNAGTLPSHL